MACGWCMAPWTPAQILTRGFIARAVRSDVRPASALAVRFGPCPVFLMVQCAQGEPGYVFQVDVRVDTEKVCREEGYSHYELYETMLDASMYNAEHRVEEVPPVPERERRRSSMLARQTRRRKRSSLTSTAAVFEGRVGGLVLSAPVMAFI